MNTTAGIERMVELQKQRQHGARPGQAKFPPRHGVDAPTKVERLQRELADLDRRIALARVNETQAEASELAAAVQVVRGKAPAGKRSVTAFRAQAAKYRFDRDALHAARAKFSASWIRRSRPRRWNNRSRRRRGARSISPSSARRLWRWTSRCAVSPRN